jgi:hypothetical protein
MPAGMAIRAVNERGKSMATKTVFIAQAFHWNGDKLEPGLMLQYSTSERAEAAGASLCGSAPGVAVFSLDGHPDADDWGEPVLLAAYGRVPSVAA